MAKNTERINKGLEALNLTQSVLFLEQNIKDSVTNIDRELGQHTDPSSVQRVHKNDTNHWDQVEYQEEYQEDEENIYWINKGQNSSI